MMHYPKHVCQLTTKALYVLFQYLGRTSISLYSFLVWCYNISLQPLSLYDINSPEEPLYIVIKSMRDSCSNEDVVNIMSFENIAYTCLFIVNKI